MAQRRLLILDDDPGVGQTIELIARTAGLPALVQGAYRPQKRLPRRRLLRPALQNGFWSHQPIFAKGLKMTSFTPSISPKFPV